jgi:RNA polymerase sigma-70 factor (ECF subfamily)
MPAPGCADAAPDVPDFLELYDAHAKFVWRATLRLGVSEEAIEDVVQEIFLVVHRRLPEFEGRSSPRTWIYGIALRVARCHRRTALRRRIGANGEDPEPLAEDPARAPDAILEKTEAARLVSALLDELDDDLREVFVLAELEEMSLAEIAEIVGANANTVSSRLRAARKSFDRALARARARDEWRIR